jgi:hypothetical protein
MAQKRSPTTKKGGDAKAPPKKPRAPVLTSLEQLGPAVETGALELAPDQSAAAPATPRPRRRTRTDQPEAAPPPIEDESPTTPSSEDIELAQRLAIIEEVRAYIDQAIERITGPFRREFTKLIADHAVQLAQLKTSIEQSRDPISHEGDPDMASTNPTPDNETQQWIDLVTSNVIENLLPDLKIILEDVFKTRDEQIAALRASIEDLEQQNTDKRTAYDRLQTDYERLADLVNTLRIDLDQLSDGFETHRGVHPPAHPSHTPTAPPTPPVAPSPAPAPTPATPPAAPAVTAAPAPKPVAPVAPWRKRLTELGKNIADQAKDAAGAAIRGEGPPKS